MNRYIKRETNKYKKNVPFYDNIFLLLLRRLGFCSIIIFIFLPKVIGSNLRWPTCDNDPGFRGFYLVYKGRLWNTTLK